MIIPSQTFTWLDFPLVFLLLFVEILLSADNAAAISIIARQLPKEKRRKALFLGLSTSVVLRLVGILLASHLIQFFWVQILGGAYLLFLGIRHILHPDKKAWWVKSKGSMWKTVIMIELTDLMFALDSILAAFALASLYYPFEILPQKLWVIYLGGIFGVITIRFAATGFMKILDAYPTLERMVFLIIGWMGMKLIAEGIFEFFPAPALKQLFDGIFWLGSVIIFAIGFLSTKWSQKG